MPVPWQLIFWKTNTGTTNPEHTMQKTLSYSKCCGWFAICHSGWKYGSQHHNRSYWYPYTTFWIECLPSYISIINYGVLHFTHINTEPSVNSCTLTNCYLYYWRNEYLKKRIHIWFLSSTTFKLCLIYHV
jgi:hypothetical protein